MSKAFTRETDDDAGGPLPDRPVSTNPNLVTANGLAALEAEIERQSGEHQKAVTAGDREAAAKANRELRYLTARRASARVQPPPSDTFEVRFGAKVVLSQGGRKTGWRIVGEDEADPAKGLISYVSPLARQLIGKTVGETVRVGDATAVLESIEV